MKYRTTSAKWTGERWMQNEDREWEKDAPAQIPDPVVPSGDGWELVGATATKTRLFWFWRHDAGG